MPRRLHVATARSCPVWTGQERAAHRRDRDRTRWGRREEPTCRPHGAPLQELHVDDAPNQSRRRQRPCVGGDQPGIECRSFQLGRASAPMIPQRRQRRASRGRSELSGLLSFARRTPGGQAPASAKLFLVLERERELGSVGHHFSIVDFQVHLDDFGDP
jgi:hypothetical protein